MKTFVCGLAVAVLAFSTQAKPAAVESAAKSAAAESPAVRKRLASPTNAVVAFKDKDGLRKQVADYAERAAARKEKLLRSTGGRIAREGTGTGRIVLLNDQTVLPASELAAVANDLAILLRLRIDVADGKFPGIGAAKDVLKAKQANAVVFVVADKALPRSLVAYEDAWGVANVGILKPAEKTISLSRMKKLVLRTLALTCGVGDPQSAGSTMWPVGADEELDGVWYPDIPLPNFASPIVAHMKKLGMEQMEVKTYFQACQAGWAPQPTNEVQKRVWDKVHTIPKNPMTIKYRGK